VNKCIILFVSNYYEGERDMWDLNNILLIIQDIVVMLIYVAILFGGAFLVIKYSIISAIKELKKKNIL